MKKILTFFLTVFILIFAQSSMIASASSEVGLGLGGIIIEFEDE